MKWQIILFIALMVIPAVLADTTYTTVGQNTTLFADIIATDYLNSSAYITITTQNITTVVSNQAMSVFATGRFYYDYTPTQQGEYYVSVQYYSASTLIATASSLLVAFPAQITNPQGGFDMGLTTIIALGLAAALALIIAYKLDKEHFPLKLLLVLVTMTFLLLISASAVESDKICGLTETNGVISATCAETTNKVPLSFFYVVVGLYSIFMFYVVIYFAYHVFMYFKDRGSI